MEFNFIKPIIYLRKKILNAQNRLNSTRKPTTYVIISAFKNKYIQAGVS